MENNILDGLIVKGHWLDKIFYDKKIWEIRSNNTTKRGQIALIKSGTKHIYGTVYLDDSFEIDYPTIAITKKKHKVDDLSIITYQKPHIWVLRDPKIFTNPIPYDHPQGAVIWVNNLYVGDATYGEQNLSYQ